MLSNANKRTHQFSCSLRCNFIERGFYQRLQKSYFEYTRVSTFENSTVIKCHLEFTSFPWFLFSDSLDIFFICLTLAIISITYTSTFYDYRLKKKKTLADADDHYKTPLPTLCKFYDAEKFYINLHNFRPD